MGVQLSLFSHMKKNEACFNTMQTYHLVFFKLSSKQGEGESLSFQKINFFSNNNEKTERFLKYLMYIKKQYV